MSDTGRPGGDAAIDDADGEEDDGLLGRARSVGVELLGTVADAVLEAL
ncbi:hypothetical protein [Halobellus ruber]|uniref:Uncharacterized protein n=1 Tax=Halobellus ruber TaxID=2761102 RepID=A0A7J9SLC6_9EURY|nr:hypothetical protein [Halobellus ruber]MBB6647322.1 hypothetical protein [Halobellus ruber]